jgi:hypothetical protein
VNNRAEASAAGRVGRMLLPHEPDRSD